MKFIFVMDGKEIHRIAFERPARPSIPRVGHRVIVRPLDTLKVIKRRVNNVTHNFAKWPIEIIIELDPTIE